MYYAYLGSVAKGKKYTHKLQDQILQRGISGHFFEQTFKLYARGRRIRLFPHYDV